MPTPTPSVSATVPAIPTPTEVAKAVSDSAWSSSDVKAAVVTGVFVVIGVALGALVTALNDRFRSRRDARAALVQSLRLACVEYLAVVDDISDRCGGLCERRSPDDGQYVQDADGVVLHRRQGDEFIPTDRRLPLDDLLRFARDGNRCLAAIDLLGSDDLSTQATEAWSVSHRDIEDPVRVVEMKKLVWLMKKEFGLSVTTAGSD